MELSGLSSKRPLTHDLLKSAIESLGGKILKVEITELVNQTFYAKIYVELNGSVKEIDARPSDSIALALKAGAKIYVADELFEIKKGDGKTPGATDAESLRERLRKINPEDFGRYTL
jgi:bifunctional DNase/RNase